MQKAKYIIGTVGTSLVLALGMTVPAAAHSQNHHHTNSNYTKTITNTDDHSNTVNGNCSGIIQTNVDQSQASSHNRVDGSQDANGAANGVDNSVNQNQSNSNSSSQSQSADVNFTPNCSTTNVTQQVASAGKGAAVVPQAQIVAPSGGVHAGAGGALAGESNVPSIVGLAGSVGAAGIGLALRRKAQLEL